MADTQASLHILLTADYEIFGNGEGDVRDDLLEPTDRILFSCQKYGARMTLFFDVCEYWAFDAERERLEADLGYDPAALMERQAIDAVAQGHDVQLHVHPQWLDAQYENGKWSLNMDLWRLPVLPLRSSDDLRSIRGLLATGKQTLETLIRKADPHYRCIAFRSGAYSVQPSADLIRAAVETGLRIDTSVSKGMVKVDGLYFVDFRDAPHHHKPWYVDPQDILKPIGPGPDRLLEVPIASRIEPVLLRVSFWELLRAAGRNVLGSPQIARSSRAEKPSPPATSPPLSERIRRLFRPVYIGWDFCLPQGDRLFEMLGAFAKERDLPVHPLVMIGHPKVFESSAPFKHFLSRVKTEYIDSGKAVFSTFPEFLKAFEHEPDPD